MSRRNRRNRSALRRRHGASKRSTTPDGLNSVNDARAQIGGKTDPQRDGPIVAYFPPVEGIDWTAYLNGPGELLICSDELQALSFCLQGKPAIAIVGVSRERVLEWLRQRRGNTLASDAVR